MDDSPIIGDLNVLPPAAEVGSIMHVVPRPAAQAAAAAPVTRHLAVTDAGRFTHAVGHARSRRHGASEDVIIICTAGRGWASVGADEFAVDAGNALILPRDRHHAYRADPVDPWSIWWCHATGPAARDLVDVITAGLDRPLVGLSDPDRAGRLVWEAIVSLEKGGETSGMIGASGAAYALLALLAVERRSPRPGDALHRAMDYLMARVNEDVRVNEVAEFAGVSASHLGTLFRSATGRGPIEFHSRARMARARSLLDSTSLPVSTIARELGFADPLYFSRRFRARHGLSPSDYRRIRKG